MNQVIKNKKKKADQDYLDEVNGKKKKPQRRSPSKISSSPKNSSESS